MTVSSSVSNKPLTYERYPDLFTNLRRIGIGLSALGLPVAQQALKASRMIAEEGRTIYAVQRQAVDALQRRSTAAASWVIEHGYEELGIPPMGDSVVDYVRRGGGHRLDKVLPQESGVTVGHLDNGMRYYIRRNANPTPGMGSLHLIINAGSTHEGEHQRGLAHFLEHVILQETESYKKGEIDGFLESIGCAYGADNNASTGFNTTKCTLDIPLDNPEVLGKCIHILREIADKATLSDAVIEAERGPILDEVRIRTGVKRRYFENLYNILYEGTRYPNRWPLGLEEVVRSCSPQDIRDFYDTWYRPDNMALVAVGDFDATQVEALIKQNFSSMEAKDGSCRTEDIPLEVYTPTVHTGTRYHLFSDPEATHSQVTIYNKLPPVEADGTTTLGQIKNATLSWLAETMTNTRIDQIVEREHPPFIGASFQRSTPLKGVSLCTASAIAREEEVPSALQGLMEEFKRIQVHGFTDTELTDAKEAARSALKHLEKEKDRWTTDELMERYSDHFTDGDGIPAIEDVIQAKREFLRTITVDEVNNWFRKLTAKDNRVVSTFVPEKSELAPVTTEQLKEAVSAVETKSVTPFVPLSLQTTLMQETPSPGKVIATKRYPDMGITEFTLSNGMVVCFKQTDLQDDGVVINACAPRGTIHAPLDKRPSAEIANDLVDESGLGGFAPSELAKILNGKNVAWKRESKKHISTLQLSSAMEDLETAFQIQHLAFTHPGYRHNVFDKVVKEMRELLKNQNASPTIRFAKDIVKHNTGNHPAMSTIEEEDLANANYDDAVAFHKACFTHPEDFKVVIIGNADEETITTLIEKYLASIPKGDIDTIALQETPIADFPAGITKKEMYAGKEPAPSTFLTFPSEDPNTVQSRLMANWTNYLVQTRLVQTLRAKLNKAYAPQTSYAPPQLPDFHQALSYIFFNGESGDVAELKSVAIDALRELQEEGPNAEELAALKEVARHHRKQALDSNKSWASILAGYYMMGWDPSEIERFEENLENLTIDAVKADLRRRFPLNNYSCQTLYPNPAEASTPY